MIVVSFIGLFWRTQTTLRLIHFFRILEWALPGVYKLNLQEKPIDRARKCHIRQ